MSISRDFASLANQGVTAAEFDKLDGVTATTAELNKLAGVTASTAELNVVTGGITTLGAVTAGSLGSNVTGGAGLDGSAMSVAIIRDEKSAGTQGGGSSTSWAVRELTDISQTSPAIVSLQGSGSTKRFRLQAGTYLIEWQAPGYGVTGYTTGLYKYTTTAGFVAYGQAARSWDNSSMVTISPGSFVTVVAADDTDYQIQQKCQIAVANNGHGAAAAVSIPEVYTIVKIIKLS